jgi:hypothetical protein
MFSYVELCKAIENIDERNVLGIKWQLKICLKKIFECPNGDKIVAMELCNSSMQSPTFMRKWLD